MIFFLVFSGTDRRRYRSYFNRLWFRIFRFWYRWFRCWSRFVHTGFFFLEQFWNLYFVFTWNIFYIIIDLVQPDVREIWYRINTHCNYFLLKRILVDKLHYCQALLTKSRYYFLRPSKYFLVISVSCFFFFIFLPFLPLHFC